MVIGHYITVLKPQRNAYYSTAIMSTRDTCGADLHSQHRSQRRYDCGDHHSTAQHSPVQHSTEQHSTAQHGTARHSTGQHSTARHSTAQRSTSHHSTAQHSTAQHSTYVAAVMADWRPSPVTAPQIARRARSVRLDQCRGPLLPEPGVGRGRAGPDV